MDSWSLPFDCTPQSADKNDGSAAPSPGDLNDHPPNPSISSPRSSCDSLNEVRVLFCPNEPLSLIDLEDVSDSVDRPVASTPECWAPPKYTPVLNFWSLPLQC